VFSPVAMKRASVVVLERDERSVLRALGRLGAIHLLRTKAGPDTAPLEPPDRTADLARCDELLSRLENLRRRLLACPEHAAPAPAAESQDDLAEMALSEADALLRSHETQASALLARRDLLRARSVQLQDMQHQVEAYKGLDLPFDRLGKSVFLHFAVGNLPAEGLEKLRAKVDEHVVLLPLAPRHGRVPLVAVTSRKGQYALETALEESKFRHEGVCVERGTTPEAASETCALEQESVAAELADVESQVGRLVQEADRPLGDIERHVTALRHILEAEQNFPRTEATVLVCGWVPAPDVAAMEREVQRITHGRCVVQAADPEDVPEREIPVLLRHSRIVRPFLLLLENYGLPTYREIEPTLFMAVSYVIMFGMMFGDAGNGAVVAAGGLYLALKSRTQAYRDAGLLLILAGLSSVGFGIYYGSYFGITKIGGHHLGHDPLSGSPLVLMLAAVAIGILLMSMGLVLNIINRLRRGEYLNAVMDKFGLAGVVFYWGILGMILVLKFTEYRHSDYAALALVLVIVLPLGAIAVKEPLVYLLERRRGGHPHASSLGEACIESAIEAFDTVLGYLSNTVSFVRLAAYAMSHAAVLMASLVIADQMTKVAPGAVGTILWVIVMILGNAVAILLEGIVASVQALRLEFYEFFGKFFSGSGQAFKPFRIPTRDHGLSPQG